MQSCSPRSLLIAIAILIPAGCQQISSLTPNSSWHQQCGWKAEAYFDDPKVIALCKAIEADDIAEIDRLVSTGANVNAKGKGNMTPLLWAYPDNKLPRFKRLLEHGADPNIVIQSDFNSHGGMTIGDSVTHLACRTAFPGYFDAVFDHDGDPNLVRNWVAKNQTPIYSVITGASTQKSKQVKRLIELGANLDHVDSTGSTPAMVATGRAYFDLALIVLEAGADPSIYQENGLQKLSHVVVRQESRLKDGSPELRASYDRIVSWLNEHGESVAEAKNDIKRWDSWSRTSGEYQRKSKQEVAQRKAREAREKNAVDGKANQGNNADSK